MQYSKDGGAGINTALFSNLGKGITSFGSSGNNKLTTFMDKASEQIDRASKLTSDVSRLSDQVINIKSSVTSSLDTNFTSPQLIASQPLGTNDNFQSFGDYVCIKKSFLDDMRRLLFQLMANR